MKKKLTVRNITLGSGALVLACILCAVVINFLPDPEPSATEVARSGSPAQVQETEEPTDLRAIPHPQAHQHAKPTNTPRPTNTPIPTLPPTPVPDPIILAGTGDQVVDLDKWTGAALVHVIGPKVKDNFVLMNYDDTGETIDLFVNTIGAYDGWQLIDFMGDPGTTRFSVEAGGAWTIEVYPFYKDYLHYLSVPGVYSGASDDVFVLVDSEPDLLKAGTTSESNFVVYGIRLNSGYDLLVNEIGPYTGTVPLPRDTFILIVNSEGPYTLEVTTR